MNALEFNDFWTAYYRETIPVPHFFKQDCKQRWFRIQNISGSKQIASNAKKWNLLLEQHNQIITDFFGENTNIFGVTGEYDFDGTFETPEFVKAKVFKGFVFNALYPINMHRISSLDYKSGTTFRPYITELTWKFGAYDHLLKEIAKGEVSMFFISAEKKCIIAPYYGGIDFVLENAEVRDRYSEKYKDLLYHAD
jgi:hypothetical protein